MPKIKKIISGKIISPKTIEIVDANRSGLIPGQKVLVYTTTGHDIVSASGRIIGKKEKVLGSGEVKIDGNKLIVRSPTPHTLFHHIKQQVSYRLVDILD